MPFFSYQYTNSVLALLCFLQTKLSPPTWQKNIMKLQMAPVTSFLLSVFIWTKGQYSTGLGHYVLPSFQTPFFSWNLSPSFAKRHIAFPVEWKESDLRYIQDVPMLHYHPEFRPRLSDEGISAHCLKIAPTWVQTVIVFLKAKWKQLVSNWII